MILVGEVLCLVEFANILGCKITASPLKYLGLPLGVTFKAKFIWNLIVRKMERRMAGWQRLYLCKGD